MMGFFKKNIKKLLGVSKEENQQVLKFLNSNVRHFMPSYVLSLDDEPFQPNIRLIDLSLLAIRRASEVDLSDISNLCSSEISKYLNVWPGEHYKLLAGIIDVLQPRIVIEIGTATGASALAMKKYLPQNSRIVTYDIISWDKYTGTCLKKSDFDEQLEQRVIDLTIKENALTQVDLIKNADLIFIDAAKDGKMEQIFCDLLDSISFNKNPIVVFDNIKFITMLKIWRSIKHPKLDLTSFGHWSGTGIVEWNGKND